MEIGSSSIGEKVISSISELLFTESEFTASINLEVKSDYSSDNFIGLLSSKVL